MDEESLIETLTDDYNGYFKVRGDKPPKHLYDPFMQLADERINDMLSGGYDLDEAYEHYKEEIVGDIEFLIRRYER